jgi:hypothetical protein
VRSTARDGDARHLTRARSIARGAIRGRLHQRIERAVVREIARVIRASAPEGSRLLHVHARQGRSTLFLRDQISRSGRPLIYDEQDRRDPDVRTETDICVFDLETATFPAPDEDFELIVWNRDVVSLKNAVPALREVRRILRTGGIFIVTVPNLAALHNRLLLLAGRQPTTLHVNDGDHVRGVTARSMTRLLERDLGFRVQEVVGVGLAPITGAILPRRLRGLSHTVVWALRKPAAE